MINKQDENILDSSRKDNLNSSIDFDLKMVRGMALTYFIYGFIYFLDIQAFLVPLPIVFYMLPLAAIVMFVRSMPSLKAVVLLFLPFLVLKDILIDINPYIMEPLVLLCILIWLGWGVSFFVSEKLKKTKYSVIAGASQFLILFILIDGHWLIFPLAVLVAMVMLTVFIRANLENSKLTIELRVSFLIQLIYILYLMQVFSYWQNS